VNTKRLDEIKGMVPSLVRPGGRLQILRSLQPGNGHLQSAGTGFDNHQPAITQVRCWLHIEH
jgi:hypothetical protein